MAKVVRLTESDLHRIVKRAIQESKRKKLREQPEHFFNPEAMETGDAILTMVLTTLGLLGFAGSHYIKSMINKLREKGEDEKADKVEKALMDAKGNMNDMDDEIDEQEQNTGGQTSQVGDF